MKGKRTKSRSSRQFFVAVYPPEVDYPDEFQNVVVTRPAQAGDMCTTPEGEEGSCVPMKKCYHFMYGNDLDGDGVYEGNLELANMLREASSGTCRTDGPFKYEDEGVVRTFEVLSYFLCLLGMVCILRIFWDVKGLMDRLRTWYAVRVTLRKSRLRWICGLWEDGFQPEGSIRSS